MDMHEEDYDDYDEDYEPVAKFRVLRILFGILSIAAFGYLGYTALQNGLANPSENLTSGTGFTYIVLALCMLVSGLLLLILQKSNTVFAFLLPMAIYLAAAVFAFLKRAGEPFLLYIAVAGVVLALLFLILTIASRKVSDEDEDYEDEEEEEEDDDYDISFDDYE